VKLCLNRSKIGEDVRMIELDVVEDRNCGTVVHHLRAFIEESCVVFVSLYDEVASSSAPCRHPKIQRHPPDQEPWGKPGIFKDPREHR